MKAVSVYDNRKYIPTLKLGEHGITLGNLILKVQEDFLVLKDPQSQTVKLKGRSTGIEFAVWSDGKYAYIDLWGTAYIFHPFLNLPWLKRLIGLK